MHTRAHRATTRSPPPLVPPPEGAGFPVAISVKECRFRLAPTPSVARDVGRTTECRFVFNRGLGREGRFQRGEKHLGYAALYEELTGWRHAAETAFLAEAPMDPQQTLKDLDRAYRNLFEGRAEPPRSKMKGHAFRYPDPSSSPRAIGTVVSSCPSSVGCATARAESVDGTPK